MTIEDIVNLVSHPITKQMFVAQCRTTLDHDGVLVLSDFIKPSAVDAMLAEGEAGLSTPEPLSAPGELIHVLEFHNYHHLYCPICVPSCVSGGTLTVCNA